MAVAEDVGSGGAAGAAPGTTGSGARTGYTPPRWAWWLVGLVVPVVGFLVTMVAGQQRGAAHPPGPPRSVAAPPAGTASPSPSTDATAQGTPSPTPPSVPPGSPPASSPAGRPTSEAGPSPSTGNDRATEPAAVPIDAPVRIVNRNSGLCLAVPGASTEVVDLNQFGCGNHPDHYWRIEPWGQGPAGPVYRIANDNSGLCAAVPAANKAAGVTVNQFPCGDYPDHLWRVAPESARDPSGRVLYRLVNDNSGLCLSVARTDTEQTAPVVQSPCAGRPEQQWRLTPR
ncbi:RICIN domain-containing protein [Streptomyces sp. NBC_01443]|uniref:RICIN domain-containing protein n=1 Tax=Streptomyces sp. NBC_01443 TaxID=2903868 RepID=UPI00225AE23E|nr:RICIN domain-containing protein [Streptomyces sp. NBC_01443]MCX4633339.1 RICIN domain-containing protein [Streptomyces sp. NBC_01443]